MQRSSVPITMQIKHSLACSLEESYRKWIREVGVDGFRIDTVKFVEHDFWNDFLHADDGVMTQAVDTGRDNFLTFGEVFETSTPYHTEVDYNIIELKRVL